MFEAIEKFRRRLASGEVLIGTSIAITDAQVSDALADAIDFLWIDLEHAAMSPAAMLHVIAAARTRAVPVGSGMPADAQYAALQAKRRRPRPPLVVDHLIEASLMGLELEVNVGMI